MRGGGGSELAWGSRDGTREGRGDKLGTGEERETGREGGEGENKEEKIYRDAAVRIRGGGNDPPALDRLEDLRGRPRGSWREPGRADKRGEGREVISSRGARAPALLGTTTVDA